jgi:hypothetical protein
MRIRIEFQIQGFADHKVKKIYSWNFFEYFYDQKVQFTYPYSLGLPTGRPSYRPSKKPSTLKREHPALHNMKIL